MLQDSDAEYIAIKKLGNNFVSSSFRIPTLPTLSLDFQSTQKVYVLAELDSSHPTIFALREWIWCLFLMDNSPFLDQPVRNTFVAWFQRGRFIFAHHVLLLPLQLSGVSILSSSAIHAGRSRDTSNDPDIQITPLFASPLWLWTTWIDWLNELTWNNLTPVSEHMFQLESKARAKLRLKLSMEINELGSVTVIW